MQTAQTVPPSKGSESHTIPLPGFCRPPVVAGDIRVHFGGPVERGRGFVLHSDDYRSTSATTTVGSGLGMTATLDVLEALAQGAGPKQALLALGYAGWGGGQLEAEIARNDWLVADPADELIFSAKDSAKWTGALRHMGIDPISLSPSSGRA